MVLNVTTFQDKNFYSFQLFYASWKGRKFFSKGPERDTDTGDFLNICVCETKTCYLNTGRVTLAG